MQKSNRSVPMDLTDFIAFLHRIDVYFYSLDIIPATVPYLEGALIWLCFDAACWILAVILFPLKIWWLPKLVLRIVITPLKLLVFSLSGIFEAWGKGLHFLEFHKKEGPRLAPYHKN